jgi:hypothetical protein
MGRAPPARPLVSPMTPARLTVLAIVCTGLGCSADGAFAGSAGTPLRVVASLHPAGVLYGDPVTAEVEVEYEPQTIEPASIRVQPSFMPYVATAAPVVQQVRAGVVRYRYSLLCVTDGCLPAKGSRVVQLERVTVSGLAGARAVTAAGSWPTLRVSSRLAGSDLSGRIHFRNSTTPPNPAYRLAPGPLSGGLIGAAVLCVLFALALVGRGLARRSSRSRERRLSPLELAIEYVRDSAGRNNPDRRRALELLAEAVDAGGEPTLAAAAAERAWAKPPPTPAVAAELADRASGVRTGAE